MILLKEDTKAKIIAQMAYMMHQITNGTVRVSIENREILDEIKTKDKSIIFAVWHQYLWLSSYVLRNNGYVALSSPSRDGEYSALTLKKLGWEVIRGSSSKGGARSLLKLIKVLKQGKDIAITPDGPRGPRHEVKKGIIYLAEKTDSVIVPLGLAIDKKKVLSSWDKFELPIPFSKAALVYGEAIEIKEKLSGEEDYDKVSNLIAKQINQAINDAQQVLGDRR